MNELEKRMNRFDLVVHNYLRTNRKTVEYLAAKVDCAPSSIWRYTRKLEYFKRAPLNIIAECLKIANVSNEDLRYILGLPTGKSNEN